MALVPVSEAAFLVSKSAQTIYRHIKQGKLSKDASGKIDTSELIRVYGSINNNNVKHVKQNVKQMLPSENTQNNDNERWLKEQIKQLQTDMQELKKESLARENRLMALLEYKSEKESQPKESEGKNFFSNLFK